MQVVAVRRFGLSDPYHRPEELQLQPPIVYHIVIGTGDNNLRLTVPSR